MIALMRSKKIVDDTAFRKDHSLTVVAPIGARAGKRYLGALCCVLTFIAAGPVYLRVYAQNRMTFSKASTDSGHIALSLALRKLSVSGTFLQAPAHPDDETNALFTLFGYGMGLRVIDVQNNRGDGGQNEI